MEKQTALSGEVLLKKIKAHFCQVPDWRDPITVTYALDDVLMSGFAIFALKFSSLLQFEEAMRENVHGVASNLTGLFDIEKVPSDTRMRELLDEVDPKYIRPLFKALFMQARRSHVLKDYRFIGNKYLISIDGKGYFHSYKIHCSECMTKLHKDTNTVSYHHQMLAASVVCPGKKTVIPLCPEPIVMQGERGDKNDCEQSAFTRMLCQLREDHPRLEAIILADALHANGPNIQRLRNCELDYLLNAKPGSHKSLFRALDKWEERGKVSHFNIKDKIGDKIEKEVVHQFRYANNILFNHTHMDITTNVIDYSETTTWINTKGEMKKTVKKFTWVTNLEITEDNVFQLMRAGRGRWKVENETFNTLKNQGYEFEHNFGHGYKHLSRLMAHLMMLVFLWDQLQEAGDGLYQKALRTCHSKRSYMWNHMRGCYMGVRGFSSWTELLRLSAAEISAVLDTG